ncbi:MAG TPA: energy-coupling factor ABC transporter substrate-binding protein [Bacillota bacterium]|nr:energy-coupling factor ABC transporter substrate-binding protein [Bacillota bacterium]
MKKNILLLGIVVLITVLPFFVQKGADFSGADGKAAQMITQLNPDYKPWYSSLWTPPSSEIESLLFALQAALGAGFVGYFIGYSKGKKHKEESNSHAQH